MTVATPDFYDYPWSAIASVTLDGPLARLTWEDGAELACHHLWLWENAVADDAVDLATREGTIDPADLPPSSDTPVRALLAQNGELEVTWPSGQRRRFHPGWLRHIADGKHTVGGALPDPVLWDAHSLSDLPTHEAAAVLADREAQRAWMNDLVRFGIARLRGAPTTETFIADLASRIGPLRDSNFGLVWNVQVNVEPDSTANTARRLAPHTDLPTREVPPGFQILHCLTNTTSGGASQMTDGLAVVEHLRTTAPDAYDALTTLHWVFFNRSPNHDHRFSGPIIDLRYPGHCGFTLRAFYPVRAFPDMPVADVERAYAGLRLFGQVCADSRFQLSSQLHPGDVVFFDNRRILHAREGFDAATGQRLLRGSYMDQDEVYSCLRVLNRRLQPLLDAHQRVSS